MSDHRVRDAFRELRRRGFLSRPNWFCCKSCAGTQLSIDAAAIRLRGRKVRGCVYFSRADQSEREQLGFFAVGFGPLNTTQGMIGEPLIAVGHEACDVFRKHGLIVDWDGTGHRQIIVVEREN